MAGAVLRAAVLGALLGAASAGRNFSVYNNAFMRDGSPVVLRSGSFHYHRCHPGYWKDRMQRLRAMGLNAIQTYVPWNWHAVDVDPSGALVYDFTAPERDLGAFLQAANDTGLLVLLRAGPYICGEHDGGGLPSNLLNISGIELRTNSSAYLAQVKQWWDTLLPNVIQPYLYSQGGPIAMVQIENEYGSYGNTGGNPGDKAYMEFLKDLAYTHLGRWDVQLYTTDGGDTGYLSHGTLPGEVFATGDGGPMHDFTSFFAAEDAYNPPGWRAHQDSEYYPGWLTHWGEKMVNNSGLDSAGGLATLFNAGGGVDLYMAYGGTNWGFWNGANGGGDSFTAVITSYDYNAPLAEGGEHNGGSDGDKYVAHQQILGFWGLVLDGQKATLPPEPPLLPRQAYGSVTLTQVADLWDNIDVLSPTPVLGEDAIHPMEWYVPVRAQGYMLYRTSLPSTAAGKAGSVVITDVRDRAEVFVAGKSAGIDYRPQHAPVAVPANMVTAGATLDILVENMGHLNFGGGILDPKGITESVAWNGTPLTGPWDVYPMTMHYNETVAKLKYSPIVPGSTPATGPAFFKGSLTISGEPADTYITVCGWTKGQIFVNGFHLGRYWNIGPQWSYYIPAPLLVSGANEIVIFEQHSAASSFAISFIDHRDFTGATCAAQGYAVPETAEPDASMQTRAGKRALSRSEALQQAKAELVVPADVLSASSCSASSPAPALGTNVTLQQCSSTSAAASSWVFAPAPFTAGTAIRAVRIQSASSPSLCVAANGTNYAGNPNLALAACDNSDQKQVFINYGPAVASAVMNAWTGNCVDITGGGAVAGTPIEMYPCTGGSNQGWTLDATTGKVTSVADSTMCLAAC